MMMDFRSYQDGDQNTDARPDSIDNIDSQPSPRLIKSHLPFHLQPKQLQTSTEAKVSSIFLEFGIYW